MISLPLSQGYVAIIDDEDAHLARFKWHAAVRAHTVYAARNVRRGGVGSLVLLHREVLNAAKGVQVDHMNRDGLDCRRENLRVATASQNQANSAHRRHASAPYKGVRWKKDHKKWEARIRFGGRDLHIGYFATAKEAACAYNAEAVKRFGQFARINAEAA